MDRPGRSPRGAAGRVAVCGALSAILTVSKLAMSFLPNIEPVSLLLMVYARVLGRSVFYVLVPFVAVEGMLYGFGMWWLSYLYVWALWAGAVLLLGRRERAGLTWAAASGAFGLSFGALCALPYLAAGGPWAAVGWWISGIPFDLLHCAGNFALALVLQRPLCRLLARLLPGAAG